MAVSRFLDRHVPLMEAERSELDELDGGWVTVEQAPTLCACGKPIAHLEVPDGDPEWACLVPWEQSAERMEA